MKYYEKLLEQLNSVNIPHDKLIEIQNSIYNLYVREIIYNEHGKIKTVYLKILEQINLLKYKKHM